MLFCLITDLIDKSTMENVKDKDDIFDENGSPDGNNKKSVWKGKEPMSLLDYSDDTDDELPDIADLLKSFRDSGSIFWNEGSNVASSSRYNIYQCLLIYSSLAPHQSFNFEKFDNESQFIKSESIDDSNSPFPIFAPKLQPLHVEFTTIFPQFPETDVDGYATVIELDDSMLNEDAIAKLKDGIQYSLTGGHGNRPRDHVPFFARGGDDMDVPMNYWQRRCAGVKA